MARPYAISLRRRRYLSLPLSPFGLVAAATLAAILLAAGAAPWLSGDPLDTSGAALQPPSAQAPFGTDLLGRDVWSRVLWGGRRTLSMGALSGGIAVALGLAVGLIAGLPRSRVIAPLILRIVDALLAFPGLLLALLIVTISVGQYGPHAGPWPVAVAVGLSGSPGYARLTYGVLRALAGRPWVEAAEAIGATRRRVLLRHLLPNAWGTLLVYATLQFGWSLLGVTGLAFLGLAGGPSIPEWGSMLAEARLALPAAPWAATAPAVAITAVVFTVNVVGDALVEWYAGR